jgi:septum formation protein
MKIDFEIVPAGDHVENGQIPCDDPFERAESNARLKAADVASQHPDAIVIGADTVVTIDGDVLEKPADDDEAVRFLKKLSGREHSVATGVAVRRDAKGVDLFARETTLVRFRELSDEDIANYVASGEGRDKAGAYAVQGIGAALVHSINGCFYNVVGLPVPLLFDLLRKV